MNPFIERVATFLLCHNQPMKFFDLARHFSKGELDRNVDNFKRDGRFSLFDVNGFLEINRQDVSAEECLIRASALKWKDDVIDCFRKNGLQTAIKLSELSELVFRSHESMSIPSMVILESDHLKKFDLVILSKKHQDVMVKYVYSQEEWGLYKVEDPVCLEEKKEEWRRRIIAHLAKQKTPVRVHTVGTAVKKPGFLSIKIKCIDVIRGDPFNRFEISEGPVKMTEQQKTDSGLFFISLEREFLAEQWRLQVIRHMTDMQMSNMLLSDIGNVVPRPLLAIKPWSLMDVIVADPLRRFSYTCKGDVRRVKLLTMGERGGEVSSHLHPLYQHQSQSQHQSQQQHQSHHQHQHQSQQQQEQDLHHHQQQQPQQQCHHNQQHQSLRDCDGWSTAGSKPSGVAPSPLGAWGKKLTPPPPPGPSVPQSQSPRSHLQGEGVLRPESMSELKLGGGSECAPYGAAQGNAHGSNVHGIIVHGSGSGHESGQRYSPRQAQGQGQGQGHAQAHGHIQGQARGQAHHGQEQGGQGHVSNRDNDRDKDRDVDRGWGQREAEQEWERQQQWELQQRERDEQQWRQVEHPQREKQQRREDESLIVPLVQRELLFDFNPATISPPGLFSPFNDNGADSSFFFSHSASLQEGTLDLGSVRDIGGLHFGGIGRDGDKGPVLGGRGIEVSLVEGGGGGVSDGLGVVVCGGGGLGLPLPPGLTTMSPTVSTLVDDSSPARIWIRNWLPIVFEGFAPATIDQFVNGLAEEGMVSVQDLVTALSLGQLTVDYFVGIGIACKLGHFNRLLFALQNFK